MLRGRCLAARVAIPAPCDRSPNAPTTKDPAAQSGIRNSLESRSMAAADREMRPITTMTTISSTSVKPDCALIPRLAPLLATSLIPPLFPRARIRSSPCRLKGRCRPSRRRHRDGDTFRIGTADAQRRLISRVGIADGDRDRITYIAAPDIPERLNGRAVGQSIESSTSS